MGQYSLVGYWSFTPLHHLIFISERVLTCDSAHSWQLYSAVPLGNQVAVSMVQYPIQSHYPDTERTSPCPILLMPSHRLGSDKYKLISHWFDLTEPNSSSTAYEVRTVPIEHHVCGSALTSRQPIRNSSSLHKYTYITRDTHLSMSMIQFIDIFISPIASFKFPSGGAYIYVANEYSLCVGQIGRAQVSSTEDSEFESQLSQTNDCRYLT